MSRNESHDIDLVKYETERYLTENQKDMTLEFVGQLQDAFAFVNREHMPEDLVFIALEKVFKEYFDGADIEIRANYLKRFLKGNK